MEELGGLICNILVLIMFHLHHKTTPGASMSSNNSAGKGSTITHWGGGVSGKFNKIKGMSGRMSNIQYEITNPKNVRIRVVGCFHWDGMFQFSVEKKF